MSLAFSLSQQRYCAEDLVGAQHSQRLEDANFDIDVRMDGRDENRDQDRESVNAMHMAAAHSDQIETSRQVTFGNLSDTNKPESKDDQ